MEDVILMVGKGDYDVIVQKTERGSYQIGYSNARTGEKQVVGYTMRPEIATKIAYEIIEGLD